VALPPLGALPATAQAPDALAAQRAALESVGGILTQENPDAVLAAAGLAAPAAADALGALIGAGEASAQGQTIRLMTGACTGVGGDAPDPAMLAARRDRVAAALAARGCRVSERDSPAFARDLGLPDAECSATLVALIGRGEAQIDPSGAVEVITLTAPPLALGT
jgi:hypothetical protein